ncbi:helix-turn-helix domain-containing protein [Mucilaginibacter sp.]
MRLKPNPEQKERMARQIFC